MRIVAVLFLAMLLAACAAPVMRNDVTTFHQWPANASDRSYQLQRLPGQDASLEHATYENVLRAELASAGFRELGNGRFAIALEYDVQSRTQQIYDYPPWLGPTVFGAIGGFRGGWGWSIGVPIGVPIFPPLARDVTSYNRNIKLVISDVQSAGAARVWEATASSIGTMPGLAPVLPYMLRALLSDFPGVNGVSRRVEVEVPK